MQRVTIWVPVIKTLRDRHLAALWQTGRSKRIASNLQRATLRKLVLLDNAMNLNDLAVVPGNHLEGLKGERKGQYSIRVNDQFGLCFRWSEGDAYDVEFVDYH